MSTKFDLTSFRCLLSIREPFSLYLRNSKFGSIIGFEQTVIRQTKFGNKLPNVTNSLNTLCIHCYLVNESIVDGIYSDVIFVSTEDLTRSYTFKDEPLELDII